MKKMYAILGLLSLILASSVQASPRDGNGTLVLRDGERVVRVSVGDSNGRNSQEMARRIRTLEMAVRSLQDRVYELEDDTRVVTREVTSYFCAVPTQFNGVFTGTGATEIEARSSAANACYSRVGGFSCRTRDTTCEAKTELVRQGY